MFASLSKWIYDNKPTYALKYEEPLSELKEMIQESGTKIFQDLLNDYFLDNTHRVTTHLYPSATYDKEQSQVSTEIAIQFIIPVFLFSTLKLIIPFL